MSWSLETALLTGPSLPKFLTPYLGSASVYLPFGPGRNWKPGDLQSLFQKLRFLYSQDPESCEAAMKS